ncbi:MAG: glycosyltransferase family 39 protein [Chloroflexi bacterium]|nr:glycosyltransferase family 39 protein [Chloroflexota bacterium]
MNVLRRDGVRRWGAIALLLVLPCLLFWQTWWPDPGHRRVFAYGDFVEQYYPMRAFVAAEWRAGRLPLWDPYTFSGEPAAATSLFAPFYPLGLWQVVFPPPFPFEALQAEAILHLGLAGVFTYLFVRRLTGRPGAGLIAGVAFSLGGFLSSYPVVQLGILETAIWLPLALWLLELAFERRSLKWSVAAGAALGCSLLAGHPQTFLYIAYLTAAYLLVRGWQLRLPWRFLATTALTLGGVAAGLSAPHWLPSLELARLSPRAHLSYADVANGFQVAELWGLFRPNAGQWSPLYIGLVPLALALIGLCLPAKTGAALRRVTPWFWAGVILVALLMALGQNGFLYPLAYRWAPGFAFFRNQERAAYLVSFALAVLAGLGYARLAGQRWWPRAALALLLALTFADLFHANSGILLQARPAGGYFAVTPAVAHLQTVSRPEWRTSTEGLLPGDGNAGLVFGLRDVSGNSPLHLEPYDRFLAAVPELRWWQMLDVQHVFTSRRLEHGALMLVLEEGDRRLYQVFQGGKPAWIVHAFQSAADQAAAITQTGDPGLNPFDLAVLEEAPAPLPAPPIAGEKAELVAFAPQRLAFDVELSAPGILVSSEIAYPGWTVAANGQRLPALRAYGLLRAVALPAGRWQVEWRYEPTTVWIGLAVSLLTLLLAGWRLKCYPRYLR